MISALRQKSKFEFWTFLKKIQIFEFPWCSTREDLSIDASITNVGLILTKLWWFQLFVKSQNLNFELFFLIQIFGFPWCSTREDLYIDVSITNVELISTRLKVISALHQKSNFEFRTFLKKKNQIFGLPWCSTMMIEAMMISFLGVRTDRRTDGRTDRQTRFWNPHLETCRHTKNFNSKLKISG